MLTTFKKVLALCPELARAASDLYHRQVSNPNESSFSGRLVHPYRGTQPRHSEQETRILLCQLLEAAGYWYSVEAPTFEQYRQRGKKDIRARSDVAVYDDFPTPQNPLPSVRIELKAYGGKIAEEDLRKDLEKLIRENVDAILFHTLPTVNRGTIPSVLQKLSLAMAKLRKHIVDRKHNIAIALCVLDKRELLLLEHHLGLSNDSSDILASYLKHDAVEAQPWSRHDLRQSHVVVAKV